MFNHVVARECLTYLNDNPRNIWYRDRLRDLVKDKVVVEIGCGSGILAAYALEYGAKFYRGIDIRNNRVQYATHILNQLGYAGRFQLQCSDFLELSSADITHPVDILMCERTADQFCSGLNLRQFWQQASRIFPVPYTSIPDKWTMDVRVYSGKLESTLSEYQPQVLIQDPGLPTGFYQAVMSTNFIQPEETHEGLLSFSPDTCHNPIEFTLDLCGYTSATVVLNDHIQYQGSPCLSISAITDWPAPIKIVVPHANAKIKFFWNDQIRIPPLYKRGYWDFIKID